MTALTDAYRLAYPDLEELWDETDQCWEIKEISGLRVAVIRFAFTCAVIIGERRDFMNYYNDRWCYHSLEVAVAAARAWEGPWPETEPTGWHRHPTTGRRYDADGNLYVSM